VEKWAVVALLLFRINPMLPFSCTQKNLYSSSCDTRDEVLKAIKQQRPLWPMYLQGTFGRLIIDDIHFPDNPEWNVIFIKAIDTLGLDITGFCVDSNVLRVILSFLDISFLLIRR